jgi:pimeloyl-ACP methyl ester carboxylesterase
MLKKVLLAALALAVVAAVAGVAWTHRHAEEFTRWAISHERQKAGLSEQVIHVMPDRLDWHVLTGGPNSAEPVVLIHGFGAEKDNWVRAAAELTPTMRVIVPDLIGFGDSDKPPQGDYRIPAQVERLHTLLQQMGIGPAHFAGNSMGGWIAAIYAAIYPDEVKSLWLLDSAGTIASTRSEMFAALERGQPLPLLVHNREEFDQRMHWVFSDPPFVPGAIKDVLTARSAATAELHERIRAQLYGVSPMLDTVLPGSAAQHLPALIVWGARDRVLSAAGATALSALLPQSKVIVMPGLGHCPMLEAPRQTARDYIAWRATLSTERSQP